MKYLILFIIATASFTAQAQDGYDCKRISTTGFSERMKHYPFSEASMIKMIAYGSVRNAIDSIEAPKLTEQILVTIYLKPTAGKKYATEILNYLSARPYIVHPQYISKEKAMAKWEKENDAGWRKLLKDNPLPESIDFSVRKVYFNKDSLEMLERALRTAFPKAISDFQYPSPAMMEVFANPRGSMLRIRVPGDSILVPSFPFVVAKALNSSQIDSLTDILYNYDVSGSTYDVSPASCYDPQNAIIFFDSEGNPFEFIEICFKCEKIRISNKKMDLGIMCKQTLPMLKKLFVSVGAVQKNE